MRISLGAAVLLIGAGSGGWCAGSFSLPEAPEAPEAVQGAWVSEGFPRAARLKERFLLPHPGTDLDRDGLADAGEAELARAFRPYFLFDRAENARRPFEPVTLFQVRPGGCVGPRSRCGPEPLRATVVYLNLWQWDGGYGPSSLCGDRHKGDNQEVVLEVESGDDGRSFRIVSVHNGAYVWPARSGAVRFGAGRHPWVYLAAGKHHQFFDTRLDGRDSPYSKWACNDDVDGEGARLLAAVELFGRPNNAGEPEAPLMGALDEHGFPGEGAWSSKPFCGGLGACAPGTTRRNADIWSRRPFSPPPPPSGR